MFDTIFNAIRPYLSRVAGSVAGYVAALLASHGIALASTDQQTLIAAVMLVFTIVYAVIHKIIDHFINPNDVASSSVKAQ